MSRRDRTTGSSRSGGGEEWVLSREAVRQLDRLACERYGIPSIVLMENAAIGLRKHALEMLAGLHSRRVMILAGPGNNGGDGFALARHLHNHRCDVRILTAGDLARYTGDAAVNLAITRAMGVPIGRLDVSAGAEDLERSAAVPAVLVDALLGTGLRDAPRGVIRDAILQVNRLRGAGVGVLAVDVPSGLDCDTGEPAGGGDVVEADATVTFAALKPGFLRLGAQRWTGDVHVAGIGAPRELVAELGVRVEDARRGLPVPADEVDEGRHEEPPLSHARNPGA